MIEILVRALIALLLLFLGIETEVPPPPTAPTPTLPAPGEGQPTMRVEIGVQNVQIDVAESLPPQVSMRIDGAVDGCAYPVQTLVSRTGNDITVTAFREMPVAIVCPAILVPVEVIVHLGELDAGQSYTITVNGTTYPLDL